MKDTFHLNTKLIGLIGHPIKQTYSPFIHNIAADLTKSDYIYLPFNVPSSSLKNAVKGIISLGIRGVNVTIPHKETIIDLMHNLSEEASMIGSVNVVVNDLGKLNGYNTDAHGVKVSLQNYKDKINNGYVAILGSGGAARAVIFTLIRNFKPKKIYLINRTEQRAETLKEYFTLKMKFNEIEVVNFYPPELVSLLNGCDLIVNSTSVGMVPDIEDSIITVPESFRKGQIVFDLVYNPVKTKLLKIAESRGATTINGITMLVEQAAKAFELWTGETMPVDKVTTALNHFISN